jgi:hypothetical protein
VLKTLVAVLALLGSMSVLQAQEPVLDPLAPCGEALAPDAALPEAAIGFWAFGYLDAATGEAHRVTPPNMAKMREVLRAKCAEAPTTRLIDIVEIVVSMERASEPPLAVEGRALLNRFFDPLADHAAMTLALKPTAEDVRAVYGEPLAAKLIANYDELFASGGAIQPKPGQTQLLTTFTTTGALKRGDPVLAEFPGGYEDVLPYIVGNVPIARFKFVEPGETLGMAFDGLVHVNERWVFMPRPWRALE